uniref:Uncharacterized protein n=1 Tax=Emiliania huxleyi TaxID=2903 RepID=A0A7S3S126_EMIHU|mmetsp:Transcript_10959/g.36131  ORF Transcript_10959/g.36131 Transcript_10959/m.36131 type:complete len:133 (-) Transcript_10959:126-524(-)
MPPTPALPRGGNSLADLLQARTGAAAARRRWADEGAIGERRRPPPCALAAASPTRRPIAKRPTPIDRKRPREDESAFLKPREVGQKGAAATLPEASTPDVLRDWMTEAEIEDVAGVDLDTLAARLEEVVAGV